jgi:hypothetical protein
MAKDAQIVAHVERVVRDAFEELAREDGRKISAYAERVLLAHLEKKGRMPASIGKRAKVKTRA